MHLMKWLSGAAVGTALMLAGSPSYAVTIGFSQVGDEGGYGHWMRVNPDIPNRQQIAARMLPAGCSAPGGTSPVLDRSASASASRDR